MVRKDKNPRRDQTGLTLIELVIVVSLIALIVTIVVPSVVNIIGANLRTTAAEVAGAIRFTYDLAARKNVPFRLVFDLSIRPMARENGRMHNSTRNTSMYIIIIQFL